MFGRTLRGRTEPFRSGNEARRVLSRINYEEDALEDIKRSLSRLMKERPVEVYAIALDLLRASRKRPLPKVIAEGVEGIARSAVRNSLLDPLLGPWTTEMGAKHGDYLQLINYHHRCSIELLEFLVTEAVIKSMGTEWIWYNTRCGVCTLVLDSFVVPSAALGTAKLPAKWWVTYWETVIASVRESPCEKLFNSGHIWDSTFQALAIECPTCHRAVAKEFPLFKEKILNAVTKIIDGVRITFVDRYVCQGVNSASNRSSWRLCCTWVVHSLVYNFAFTSAFQSNYLCIIVVSAFSYCVLMSWSPLPVVRFCSTFLCAHRPSLYIISFPTLEEVRPRYLGVLLVCVVRAHSW